MRHFIALLFAMLVSVPAAVPAQTSADSFVKCEDSSERPELAGSLCAEIATPLDHSRQDGAKISLFVRKIPADRPPKGQLWLIAGGPGESGSSFYPFLASLREAVPGYDLMIPDHRGTGFSTKLCPVEEALGSEGGMALVGTEWGSCFGSLNADPDRTRAFSITNAAFDLRSLIDRLSSGRSNFLYGVSYGTQLILRTLAVAPPRKVSGVILDSLVPPETSRDWDISHRSAVVDAVGRRLLASCDRKPSCRASLGGSASAAMQAVIEDPKLQGSFGGNPKYLFGAFLDVPELRDRIPLILADLRQGNLASLEDANNRLLKTGAQLLSYPQSTPSIPLVGLISASENNARPTLTEAIVKDEEQGYLFASPLPGLLLQSRMPLYKRGKEFGVLPKRVPPILVLQGTSDPKTPIEGAKAQVSLLRKGGRVALVTAADAPHFLLFSAPQCLVPTIRQFVERGLPRSRECPSASK